MNKQMWKFLNLKDKTIVSKHGNLKWKIGEWQHVGGKMKACGNGLHASNKIYESFSYVQGSVLAKVEVKGKHDDEKDKSAYSDKRIVKAYKWTKKDSVALAIFSAKLCLNEFEKLYPDDKRPREAIDAARAVLSHDTGKNQSAAESAARAAARAAWAAGSAESAAESAARAAARAAWAAGSAAWAAAGSAARAAWAAGSAAWAAARAAESAKQRTLDSIEKRFQDRVKDLKEIK